MKKEKRGKNKNQKAGLPIGAEVEVFTHKNRKMTYKIKNLYVDVTHSIVHLYFSALRSIGGQY